MLHQILCGQKQWGNLNAWIVQIGRGSGLSLCRVLKTFPIGLSFKMKSLLQILID